MPREGETSPSGARTLGLFLVLAILVNGITAPGGLSEPALWATFYLASFVHVGFAVHDGCFGRLRTATWLCLLVLWAGRESASFLSHVLPWGQMKFWLTAQVPGSEAIAGWFASKAGALVADFAVSSIPLLLALAADVVAMHHADWQRRWLAWHLAFLCAAGMAGVATGLGLGLIPQLPSLAARLPASLPPRIVPDWQLLPYYALLRAVPEKLYGVATMFAAVFVPMAWPWMRAYRFRLALQLHFLLDMCLSRDGLMGPSPE